MHRDVLVRSSDGAPVQLELCKALRTGARREEGSQREYSTRLYCTDNWEPTAAQQPPTTIDTLSNTTITRFSLDQETTRAVSDQIFGGDQSVTPITPYLGCVLAAKLGQIVSEALGVPGELLIRSRLKPIASAPSIGHMTGGTTDGLHLDAAQPGKKIFRVGLNLGEATRYVICGLTSLEYLREVLGEHIPDTSVTHAAKYDYSRLIDAGLVVARFEVRPGFGWLMRTEEIPHDGRRADPHLPSRFVLMEAEVI